MRVLLIEDDSATSQSIELMLKAESFNVFTADLGEERRIEPVQVGLTSDPIGFRYCGRSR